MDEFESNTITVNGVTFLFSVALANVQDGLYTLLCKCIAVVNSQEKVVVEKEPEVGALAICSILNKFIDCRASSAI